MELKNLVSGFVALAAAILILVVQGSLQPSGLAGKVGVLFMAASILLFRSLCCFPLIMLHWHFAFVPHSQGMGKG